MTEHLSAEIVERFHQQALGTGDRRVIYDHVLACEPCRQRVVDSRNEGVAFQALSDHLLPANGDEPYHLDYEMIEGYVENKLDELDRSTAELHLEVCAECLAEATDLRESLATMRAATVPQYLNKQSVRERLFRSMRFPAFSTPLRIFAIVAFAAFVVIAAVFVWRLKSGGPSHGPAGSKDLSAESKPTPIQTSTPVPGVGNLPSPNHGPSPDRLAETTPKKRLNESPEEVLALNDGPNKVTLDKSGKLVGPEALPRESQQAVRDALLAQTIQKPDVLDELAGAEVSQRAPTGNEDSARVVYPVSAVIAENRPLFEWVPSKPARAYRVDVGNASFHQVAKSEELPATSRTWTAPSALKRGVVYTWIVRVIKDGTDASISSTSQAKFKVLEDGKVKELNRLKTTAQSHLALGVFYAREGMIAQAEREFQILAKKNPRSMIAKKLLKGIQSWQSRSYSP